MTQWYGLDGTLDLSGKTTLGDHCRPESALQSIQGLHCFLFILQDSIHLINF